MADKELKRNGIVALVDRVVEQTSMKKKDADEAVRATLTAITSFLAQKESVIIPNTFALIPIKRAAREGRNPQKPTEVVKIPEKWTIKLRVGKELKDMLN